MKDKRIKQAESLFQRGKDLLLQIAREQGAADPYVFVEPESGIFVMDAALAADQDDRSNPLDRQSAIVGRGTENEMRISVRLQAGAW